jgi:hypothetical protein
MKTAEEFMGFHETYVRADCLFGFALSLVKTVGAG